MTPDDLDLEARELCSDGGCIGVIGDDGRCRVCGASPSADGEPAPVDERAERARRAATGSAEDRSRESEKVLR